LAQEAISFCRQSLVVAASMMRGAHGSTLDGDLFLVRHLLLLKEVLRRIELTRTEMGVGRDATLPASVNVLGVGNSTGWCAGHYP
jgi:conserved oligomeric Golgi complex subunit 3